MTPLLDAVPFARTLGIQFTEVTSTTATAVLPDDERLHNHIGGPHAGAMFTLAESATGAVLMAAFGDQLHRAVPLAVRSNIEYKKVAMGEVTATASLARPIADVIAELDAGQRPEFDINVAIMRPDGATSAEMTVTWTLRPIG